MKICEILRYFSFQDDRQEEIVGLSMDSRTIQKGELFLALGKGKEYIEQVKEISPLILSDEEVPHAVFIPHLKEKLTMFCCYFYGVDLSKLHLIGVVGTSGKSSIAYYLHQLLENSFLITSLHHVPHSFYSEKTTPDGPILARALAKAIEEKRPNVILEVSSIGIAEHRVQGLSFDRVIFTGIHEDHLDYHHTYKNYKQVKLSFLSHLSCPVIWKDCAEKEVDFRRKDEEYMLSQANILQKDHRQTTLFFHGQKWCLPFVEDFAIENAIGAISLAESYQGNRPSILLKAVPGRMEKIHENPDVIIDYAHCAFEMETALKEAKKQCKGKLWVLFGAGGNREKNKRKEYGKLACRFADFAIVTNDNPRKEDEKKIVQDITSGDSFFRVIYDRKKAIEEALSHAQKEDFILILGKGREEVQEIGEVKIPFSDAQVVEEYYE